MSRITTTKTEIRDPDALKSACTECGAVFVRGQTTCQWFGESVGNYPGLNVLKDWVLKRRNAFTQRAIYPRPKVCSSSASRGPGNRCRRRRVRPFL